MKEIASRHFIKKYNLTTAQDLNMWSKGWVKQDLPDHLKHGSLDQYQIDNVLMVEVRKVRDTFYVSKKSIGDLKFILSDKNPMFLGGAKPKEPYTISMDIVADDMKGSQDEY